MKPLWGLLKKIKAGSTGLQEAEPRWLPAGRQSCPPSAPDQRITGSFSQSPVSSLFWHSQHTAVTTTLEGRAGPARLSRDPSHCPLGNGSSQHSWDCKRDGWMAPLPRDTGQGGGEGMNRHAHMESRQRWKTKTGFNRDLLLQQPYWPQILLPGPGTPICSKRGKESFHFSITMILTNTSSNK